MFPHNNTSHEVQELRNRIKMCLRFITLTASQIYYSHPRLQNTEQPEIQVAETFQPKVHVKHNLPFVLPTRYSSQQWELLLPSADGKTVRRASNLLYLLAYILSLFSVYCLVLYTNDAGANCCQVIRGRLCLKRHGTCAETTFRLSRETDESI
jgi:hypothetical protein